MARPRKAASIPKDAQSYRHPDADLLARPEIGAQAHFKKAKPPANYRFDSSLAPELRWDGQNPAREQGETLLAAASDNARQLHTLLAKLREEAGHVPAADRKPLLKLIAEIEQALAGNRNALDRLKNLSKPFLNWSGKAERLSFDVPTLPLIVHERV